MLRVQPAAGLRPFVYMRDAQTLLHCVCVAIVIIQERTYYVTRFKLSSLMKQVIVNDIYIVHKQYNDSSLNLISTAVFYAERQCRHVDNRA